MLFAMLFALSAGAQAQTPPAPPSSAVEPVSPETLEDRARALQAWIDSFTRWQERRDERAGTRSGDVTPKPDPPAWLFDDCRDLIEESTGVWAEACRLLVAWADDPSTARIREQIGERRTQHEAPTHSVWWRHLHIDALWPMTELNSRTYGIVGTHFTIDVAGRLEVFLAPGAMLLSLPAPGGARDWTLATDWGIGYRLFDFSFPGTSRPASLHLNMVNAWALSRSSSVFASRISLVGFSMTFNPSAATAP